MIDLDTVKEIAKWIRTIPLEYRKEFGPYVTEQIADLLESGGWLTWPSENESGQDDRVKMLALLTSLEWSVPIKTRHYIGPLGQWYACPLCRGLKPHPDPRVMTSMHGHQPGCKLAAALASAPNESVAEDE